MLTPRTGLWAIALAAVLATLPSSAARSAESPAEAGQPTDAAKAIEGEVLDLACYITHGSTGAKHAPCAKKCVVQGQPMGLLTDDGTVFLLFAGHSDATAYDAAKQLAGKRVAISGKRSDKSGFSGIEVAEVSEAAAEVPKTN